MITITLWQAKDRAGDFSAKDVLLSLLDLPLGWTTITEQRDALNLLDSLEKAGQEDKVEVSSAIAQKICEAIESGRFAVPRLSPNMVQLLEQLKNGYNELDSTT